MRDFSELSEDYIVALRPRARMVASNVKSQWVNAVVAVVGEAIKMAQSQKFDRWQSDVSSQLGAILSALEGIQRQLREMQVWIDERIAEETRANHHNRITSLCRYVNEVITAIGSEQHNIPKPSQLEDLRENLRDLRLVISDLMLTDGFSHVMGVVAGVVCLMPLFGLFGREAEIRPFSVAVIGYLRTADDLNDSRSIAFARNLHANRYINESHIVDSRLGIAWTTNYSEGRGGGEIHAAGPNFGDNSDHNPGTPSMIYQQTAVGSLANGFSLGHRNSLARVAPNWYPELAHHWGTHDGFDVSWNEMVGNLESHRQAAISEANSEANLNEILRQIREVIALLDKYSMHPLADHPTPQSHSASPDFAIST